MWTELSEKYSTASLAGGVLGILGLLGGGCSMDVWSWTPLQKVGWLGFGAITLFGIIVRIAASIQTRRESEALAKRSREH
jgi:hypothetical protein